jgi:predicted NBD/HSP70 family sugar kinase
MKKIIGIDIGGTAIKGVLINELGEVLHRESILTNDQGGFSGWKNFVGELASLN